MVPTLRQDASHIPHTANDDSGEAASLCPRVSRAPSSDESTRDKSTFVDLKGERDREIRGGGK